MSKENKHHLCLTFKIKDSCCKSQCDHEVKLEEIKLFNKMSDLFVHLEVELDIPEEHDTAFDDFVTKNYNIGITSFSNCDCGLVFIYGDPNNIKCPGEIFNSDFEYFDLITAKKTGT